jgi:hypothetical protein
MKTDFITRKERIRFNDSIVAQELENPRDTIDVAINNLQCAQFNKHNKDARKLQLLRAIDLIKRELTH